MLYACFIKTSHIFSVEVIYKTNFLYRSHRFNFTKITKTTQSTINTKIKNRANFATNKSKLTDTEPGNSWLLPLCIIGFLSGTPLKTGFCNIRVYRQYKPIIMDRSTEIHQFGNAPKSTGLYYVCRNSLRGT